MKENFYKEVFKDASEAVDNYALKQEIARIAALEKNKEKADTDPHLANLDPGKLIEEDLSIYQSFKEGSLEKENFEAWAEKVRKDLKLELDEFSIKLNKEPYGEKKKLMEGILGPEFSRLIFSAWLTNKIVAWENYREFYDNGGKILEWYDNLAPKKWIAGEIRDKEKITKIHPADADIKKIFSRNLTTEEIKDLEEKFGKKVENVKEVFENPGEEVKKDYNRWTGLLERE